MSLTDDLKQLRADHDAMLLRHNQEQTAIGVRWAHIVSRITAAGTHAALLAADLAGDIPAGPAAGTTPSAASLNPPVPQASQPLPTSGPIPASEDPGEEEEKDEVAAASHPAPPPASPPSPLDAWPGGKLPPGQFIAMLRPAADQAQRDTGVPAVVTIAQAALETGWGSSSIGGAKNLFGIKGTGPAGSVNEKTHEYEDGKVIEITAAFRAYHTWQESIDDHAAFLSKGPRYQPAMAVKSDPAAFARAIAAAGYATEPDYADQLILIMQHYGLLTPAGSPAIGTGGLTRAKVVARMRSMANKPCTWTSGAELVLINDTTLGGTKSDCSGAVDAANGIDRNETGTNTAAMVKDAEGAQRYYAKVAPTMDGPAKPGDVCVYTAEPMGHTGVVTEVDASGKPTMVAHCSTGNPVGRALQETVPDVFVKHKAMIVRCVNLVDA